MNAVIARSWRAASCLLVAVATAACSAAPPPTLVVDPGLAQGEVLAVQGKSYRTWGDPLTFGKFSTRKTRVGESDQWSAGLFGVGAGERRQPYRFVFVDEAGGESRVECRARTPVVAGRSERASWSVPTGETRLGCVFRDADGSVRSLRLHGTAFELAGDAELRDGALRIGSLHDLVGRDGKPHSIPVVLGYELRQGERVVASVDLQGKGRVLLAPDLDPGLRAEVARVAAALMFFGQD